MVSRVIRTPLVAAVVALWVLGALLAGTAGAAHPGNPEGEGPVYSACRRLGGDIIKIHLDTEADRPCKPWQTVITWSAQGPQGPQGIQGIQGVPGEPGADGAPGVDGEGFRVDCVTTEIAQWDGTEWQCSSALADAQAELADLLSQFSLLLATEPGRVQGNRSIWEDTGVTDPGCNPPLAATGENDGLMTEGGCSTGSPNFFTLFYGEPGTDFGGSLSNTYAVNLLSASGDLIDSTTTASGFWQFEDVEPLLDYMVEYVVPAGWQFTVPGGTMTIDPATGRSSVFTMPLGGNISNPGVAGFVPTT